MNNVKKLGNKIHIIILFLLIAVINELPVSARLSNTNDPPLNRIEKIFVHTNKNIYVAGENLYYKVYVENGESPLQIPESKILYFTLSNNKSNKHILWRVNLDKSSLYGSYRLPENLDAGIYELSVYTNQLRECPAENIFSRELFILNLSKTIPDSVYLKTPNVVVSDSLIRSVASPVDKPAIRLENLKPVYRPKNKVVLEIRIDNLQPNDTSDLSFSVTAETPLKEVIQDCNIIEQFDRHIIPAVKPCLHGPENYTYMLKGRLLYKSDGSPVKDAKIFLAVTDTVSPKIMYSSSDTDGNFCFYLNHFYDNKEIILQLSEGTDISKILWDMEDKYIEHSGVSDKLVQLRPEQVAFLNQIKNIRLIDKVYHEGISEKKAYQTTPGMSYLSCPDITIFPSEYTELVNFKEIVSNIMPQVKLKTHDNIYYLQVYNNSKAALGDNNLVLLNGIPFYDMNYIATLGTRGIQRIEITNSDRFFVGNLAFNAIVAIYTYDGKIPEPYLKQHTLVLQNPVSSIDPAGNQYTDFITPDQSQTHLPDFRSNLYWNPEIKVSGSNKISIEFTTSRLTGKYKAQIQGITSSGVPLNTSISFSVE
jgi:hypothetical protein